MNNPADDFLKEMNLGLPDEICKIIVEQIRRLPEDKWEKWIEHFEHHHTDMLIKGGKSVDEAKRLTVLRVATLRDLLKE